MVVHALIALAVVYLVTQIHVRQNKSVTASSALQSVCLFVLAYCFAEYVVDMSLRGMGWL